MKCSSQIEVEDKRKWTNENKTILVPCGKCGACKYNRRQDWTFRLKEEHKSSSNAFFTTLTYKNDELPLSKSRIYPSLRKSDWQKFIKRLRKRNKKNGCENLRYYGVGEYGTKTGRPHYHALLFNVSRTCIENLENIWIAGHCMVDQVTAGRIGYITKYHVNANEDEIDREEEFSTMSKNPGIGYQYIEDNGKWHRENMYNHVISGGR